MAQAQKIDAKRLIVVTDKSRFRRIDDGYVAELVEVLKSSGDKWPFPNDERQGVKVAPEMRTVKDAQGERTEETGNFIVIAGAHRVTAAQAVKWGDVPVYVIRPKNELDALRTGIASNVEHGRRFKVDERDDLIRRVAALGMTQADIADLFNVNQGTVSRVIRGVTAEGNKRGAGKAKGGKAKRGSKKGKKKSRTFTPADFINEGVISLGRFADAHHEAIVAYASGNDRAAQAMNALASTLLTLCDRAIAARTANVEAPTGA